MIEQQGQVVRLQAENAYVRVGATTGCPTCESGKGCGGGIFARLVPKKPVTLEVPILTDSPRVAVGQQVMLGLPDVFFLRWTGVMFGLPLLFGLAAAGLVQWGLNTRAAGASAFTIDILVLLSAVLAATVTLLLIRRRAESMLQGVRQLRLLSILPGSGCSNNKA
ncbi:MAG: SoxR reducing system RseC family protein [Proteobacteria bacterium]|nr:SoxR reducing system RseC family protein [Pseudomonadota bacterium]